MSEPTPPGVEVAAPLPPAGRPAHIGLLRFSTVEFLIALVLMFVASPFVEHMRYGRFVERALMTLVLVSAVLAVGRRRRTLVLAAALVLPPLVGKWLDHYWPELVSPAFFPACALVFILFVTVNLLLFILRAARVNREVLCAGISAYLLCGLLWALAYMLVGQVKPDAFSYASGPASGVVTLSTVPIT